MRNAGSSKSTSGRTVASVTELGSSLLEVVHYVIRLHAVRVDPGERSMQLVEEIAIGRGIPEHVVDYVRLARFGGNLVEQIPRHRRVLCEPDLQVAERLWLPVNLPQQLRRR